MSNYNCIFQRYKNCTAWRNAKETSLKNEMNLFDESVLMKNLIYNVSKRLGFSYNLSSGEVQLNIIAGKTMNIGTPPIHTHTHTATWARQQVRYKKDTDNIYGSQNLIFVKYIFIYRNIFYY